MNLEKVVITKSDIPPVKLFVAPWQPRLLWCSVILVRTLVKNIARVLKQIWSEEVPTLFSHEAKHTHTVFDHALPQKNQKK